jgi:CheY-like chemotaxis protein/anti-sigma regulatory factor (Ser/Thr protein kinase)
MIKILIIDDDAINVEILESHLLIAGYEAIKAYSGEEGWDVLQKHQNISVILLDRMMSGVDGIKFMQMLSESEYNIPVIMQTAAADHKSIVEGLKSGVYYYLTKPFTNEMMLAIIDSALNDLRYKKELIEGLKQNRTSISLISKIELNLKNHDDIYDISHFLACTYPDPEKHIVGIVELLTNAVEHGNLSIGLDKKSELLTKGRLEEEIDKRLSLPENKNKYVNIELTKNSEEIVLRIKDCGKGFNYEDFFEISPERALLPNGRGIVMTKISSFEDIEYLNGGNEVVCREKLNSKDSKDNFA